MAVSKRTRFEVLRRDNYTCRYCRARDQTLTVDHVTPVALGGSDKPDNLVAACKDCNVGKSSSAPDSSLVAEVSEDALRHAEMIRQAYAVVVERMGERDDYIEVFDNAYTYDPRPDDWRESVGRWFEMGVPIALVVDAATKSCAITRRFQGDGRFKYMCGIVWNQVHAVNEAVELKSAILGSFVTEESRIEDAQRDYAIGYDRGESDAALRWAHADSAHRGLLNVIERTHPEHRANLDEYMDHASPHLRAPTPGSALQPNEVAW